jgi:hypothetical protein
MAQTKVKEANGEAESLKLKAKAQSEAKIMMAEADSTQIRLTKQAEATGIEAIGKANAEAYEKQVKAMGTENFAKFKIMEEIGKNGIKIMPDLLISGGESNGGPMSALLGLEVLKKYGSDYEKVDTVKVPEKPTAKPGDKPVK